MKHTLLAFVALFFLLKQSYQLFAQTTNEVDYQLHIKKATGKIVVDGKLDEPDWQSAQRTGAFWQQFPYDTSRAEQQTETRLTFDDDNLYISFVVYQPRKYVVQSLKRDFPNGGGTDLVIVNFDTFKDKQNAFHFAVNPYGVQREGLLSGGEIVSNDWDNKWYTQVKNEADRWVVESAIPFKSIRYKVSEGINEWNIQLYRNNLLINERSSWTPFPRGFPGNSIAFAGTLIWDQPPPTPGANISLIPYMLGGVSEDYLKGTAAKIEKNVGFDAKVAITPSLNLDLTVNPDFAQVEVDQQVTNLSRFELFFPERRQFFLENADLFGTFGFTRINPFFSRRIGLVRSPVTGENVKNTIIAGARLSGKIDNNWRVGLLNMQTASDQDLGLVANNFTVGVLQRRVFTRSNVSAIVVNKQSNASYNRMAGLEYNLASGNGFWKGKLFHHQLFTPNDTAGQFAQGLRVAYTTPRFSFESQTENIGINYAPEVGYAPRRGYVRNSGSVAFSYYPKGKIGRLINSWSLIPDWDIFVGKKEGRVLDGDAGLFGEVQFQNNARLTVALFRVDYTYLFADFDPSGKNDPARALKAGTDYFYRSSRASFQSNNRKPFYALLEGRVGDYFNGRILNLNVTANYRYQPFALFALNVSYNRVRLPAGFNSADLWLVGPRMDWTFSRSVFLTTIAQYNNQTNNMNLNVRFQWRFKPVSDFFVVYTDNYFTQDTISAENRHFNAFQSKNRALVVKLTYWLNL
jgi:Domain of unknown function (DUF5916)